MLPKTIEWNNFDENVFIKVFFMSKTRHERCPHCGSLKVIKWGRQRDHQLFLAIIPKKTVLLSLMEIEKKMRCSGASAKDSA